MSHTISLNRL